MAKKIADGVTVVPPATCSSRRHVCRNDRRLEEWLADGARRRNRGNRRAALVAWIWRREAIATGTSRG